MTYIIKNKYTNAIVTSIYRGRRYHEYITRNKNFFNTRKNLKKPPMLFSLQEARILLLLNKSRRRFRIIPNII